MTKKERNPLKIMMLVNLFLVVGLIAIVIFWNQKTDGTKVGYFLPKSDEEPVTTVTPVAGTPTA